MALFGKTRNRAARRQKNYILTYYQLLSIIFNSIKRSGNRKFAMSSYLAPTATVLPQAAIRRPLDKLNKEADPEGSALVND